MRILFKTYNLSPASKHSIQPVISIRIIIQRCFYFHTTLINLKSRLVIVTPCKRKLHIKSSPPSASRTNHATKTTQNRRSSPRHHRSGGAWVLDVQTTPASSTGNADKYRSCHINIRISPPRIHRHLRLAHLHQPDLSHHDEVSAVLQIHKADECV